MSSSNSPGSPAEPQYTQCRFQLILSDDEPAATNPDTRIQVNHKGHPDSQPPPYSTVVLVRSQTPSTVPPENSREARVPNYICSFKTRVRVTRPTRSQPYDKTSIRRRIVEKSPAISKYNDHSPKIAESAAALSKTAGLSEDELSSESRQLTSIHPQRASDPRHGLQEFQSQPGEEIDDVLADVKIDNTDGRASQVENATNTVISDHDRKISTPRRATSLESLTSAESEASATDGETSADEEEVSANKNVASEIPGERVVSGMPGAPSAIVSPAKGVNGDLPLKPDDHGLQILSQIASEAPRSLTTEQMWRAARFAMMHISQRAAKIRRSYMYQHRPTTRAVERTTAQTPRSKATPLPTTAPTALNTPSRHLHEKPADAPSAPAHSATAATDLRRNARLQYRPIRPNTDTPRTAFGQIRRWNAIVANNSHIMSMTPAMMNRLFQPQIFGAVPLRDHAGASAM